MKRFFILLGLLAAISAPAQLILKNGYWGSSISQRGITNWPAHVFIDFEQGNSGDAMTTNLIAASQVGTGGGSWMSIRTNANSVPLLFTTVAGTNAARRVPYSVGGNSYDGSGTRALLWTMGNDWSNRWESLKYTLPVTVSNVSVSMLVKIDEIGQATQDLISMSFGGSGGWANFQHVFNSPNLRQFRVHGKSVSGDSTFSYPIDITSNTWYSVTVMRNSDAGEVQGVVCDTAGNVVGSTRVETVSTNAIATIALQDYLSFTAGSNTFDSVGIGWTNLAMLPMEPITVQTTTNTIYQTASNTLALSWTGVGLYYDVWMTNVTASTNASLYSLLPGGSNGVSFTYSNTAAADQQTYNYAVRARIGTNVSAWSATTNITVANSNFAASTYLISEGAEGGTTPSGWTNTGTITWNMNTSPLEGTYSLKAQYSTNWTTYGLPSTYTNLNAYLLCQRVSYGTAVEPCVEFIDGSGNVLFSLNTGTGSASITHGSTSSTTTTMSSTTTYSIWLEYQKGTGANGVGNLYVSTNTTKPGSPTKSVTTGTATADVAAFRCRGTVVSVYFDHMRVTANSIGSSPL